MMNRAHVVAVAFAVAALLGDLATVDAGDAHSAPQPNATCPSMQPNVCQQTADLLVEMSGSGGPEACCAACTAQPLCAAFTHNTQSNHCYLHSNWVAPTPGQQCTSGHVRTLPTAPSGAKNVVLIVVDDLRPEMLVGYNQSVMHTPNLDALAESGTVFERAYCQQAICGPTRNSFLSGRRPQRTQCWNFVDSFREVGPDWLSLFGYFKLHDYLVLGTGKNYHPGLPKNDDGALSWSTDRPYVDHTDAGWNKPSWASAPSLVMPDVTPASNLSHYRDGANLQAILDDFDYVTNASNSRGRPFFLSYGAHRPHLPWHIPEEMWDLYPEEVPLPKHQEAPKGMPPIAFTYELDGKTTVDDLGNSYPIPFPHNDTLPPNATRDMRRAYYAAVSYTDHLIGILLDRLDSAGLTDDTVVALIGDHGWQLGEHNIWGKHTNFELGTRVPFIVRAPGKPAARAPALVESVDLYPTLASLAGLPPPPDVDGVDLSPLVGGGRWPSSYQAKTPVAFSEYPRCPKNVSTPWTDTTSCIKTDRHHFTVMGYSVRTEDWRYTVWLWWDGDALQGDFTRPPVGEELYDHRGDDGTDMDAFENVNVAADPANSAIVQQHYALAKAQWDTKGSRE